MPYESVTTTNGRIAVSINKITGSRAAKKLLAVLGNSAGDSSFGWNVFKGSEGTFLKTGKIKDRLQQ